MMLTGTSFFAGSDFLSTQKKNPRVAKAYKEKQSLLTSRLKELNLSLDNIHILLVVYKNEKQLELYVKQKQETHYRKLTTYAVCRTSGEPGPKRSQGDLQIPEGFYSIDRFNPNSSFYLSLRISYPNSSDRILCKSGNPGGDIYIHGECVTIGCMPITNDKIQEVYIYAIQAKENGQNNIPVYIFPFRLTDSNLSKFREQYKTDKSLLEFWNNLKTGYDRFTRTLSELKVTVDGANGKYLVQ